MHVNSIVELKDVVCTNVALLLISARYEQSRSRKHICDDLAAICNESDERDLSSDMCFLTFHKPNARLLPARIFQYRDTE